MPPGLGFKKYANINNAINPARREYVIFMVASSNEALDHSTPEGLAIANKDLQENILLYLHAVFYE
jgi:BioD-like phosphotransacetylase family protein